MFCGGDGSRSTVESLDAIAIVLGAFPLNSSGRTSVAFSDHWRYLHLLSLRSVAGVAFDEVHREACEEAGIGSGFVLGRTLHALGACTDAEEGRE